MKKKGKVMVEVKTDIPMGPRDFSGLCFFGKQRNAAARTATRQSFTAIAFLIRPALAAGMRDENEYPICWFSAKKLFELLPPQDVSFLKRTFNLLVYARVNAIENNFSNEISYFVLENFLLNEGKGFRLDTISKDLLKALIRTQSSVFHNSPNAELYDVQQKRKVTYSPVFTESYFKKTSIEAIDEISFNSNVQTYKRVDISEPIVLPNSNTFEFKKGKVEKIFVYLDTTGKATSFDFQTKKSYYEFYYNREAIESNFLIKNLVWWLEDYYRYIKTQK